MIEFFWAIIRLITTLFLTKNNTLTSFCVNFDSYQLKTNYALSASIKYNDKLIWEWNQLTNELLWLNYTWLIWSFNQITIKRIKCFKLC